MLKLIFLWFKTTGNWLLWLILRLTWCHQEKGAGLRPALFLQKPPQLTEFSLNRERRETVWKANMESKRYDFFSYKKTLRRARCRRQHPPAALRSPGTSDRPRTENITWRTSDLVKPASLFVKGRDKFAFLF